jgi:hypothetical protein
VICIHCEHQFVGGAFIRCSGPGTSVAMRRCPKCNKEFVAPPKSRAPGKVVALQAEIDAIRAENERLRGALGHAARMLRGETEVLDQGDAYDRALDILDAALAEQVRK